MEENNTIERKSSLLDSYVVREVLLWIETILAALIIVLLIDVFFFRMVAVDGASMMPGLNNGDRIISTSFDKNYSRGDIVVIRRKDNNNLIKRIIAVEGDELDINFETGEVIINGVVIDEPYINEPTMTPLNFEGAVTVPENHVFVMGDNRNDSNDSRAAEIGFIDVNNIFGKAAIRIFPLDKFGKIS